MIEYSIKMWYRIQIAKSLFIYINRRCILLIKRRLTAIAYWIVWFVGQKYIQKNWNVSVVNVHHIPKKGPVILAANHLKVIDSPLLAITTNFPPRRVTFLAKSEYFQVRSIKGLFITLGFYLIGQIPLNRSGGNDATKGLIEARQLLLDGGVLGVHVEGTRSPDGKLYEARSGFVRLAIDTKATIVPVAITYDEDSPVNGKHQAKLQFGKPLTYDEYKDKHHREIAKMTTKEIQKMSGQTLAGQFAKIISRFVGRND